MSDDGYETRLASGILDALTVAGAAAAELKQAVRLLSDAEHARDVAVLKAEVARLRGLVDDRDQRIDVARQTFEHMLVGANTIQKIAIENILPMLTPVEPK